MIEKRSDDYFLLILALSSITKFTETGPPHKEVRRKGLNSCDAITNIS